MFLNYLVPQTNRLHSTRGMSSFSHIDNETERVKMVDVGMKNETKREAVAVGSIWVGPEVIRQIQEKKVAKGNVFTVAQIAGIFGAKRTSDLIPLCHQLKLDNVQVDLHLDRENDEVVVIVRVISTGKTGVEMEALTGVAISCLTIYDMVKAVNKGSIIKEIKLRSKGGGKSGDFVAPDEKCV